jgi:hypothetical protein
MIIYEASLNNQFGSLGIPGVGAKYGVFFPGPPQKNPPLHISYAAAIPKEPPVS